MHRTETLRRQHDSASALAATLVGQIEAYRGSTDAAPIALTVAKLLGLLRIHLALEDKLLYPSMIASADTQAAAVARTFASEMGSLAESVGAFGERWLSAKRIASQFEDFRVDALSVVTVLGDRIRRENDELYPLADNLNGWPQEAA